MVMVCLILRVDLHRKVGIDLGAVKIPSGVVIRLGSCLCRIRNSKPRKPRPPRIPDLSGVFPPCPLSYPMAYDRHLRFQMHLLGIGARLNASNFTWNRFRYSIFKIKNNYNLYVRYNNLKF